MVWTASSWRVHKDQMRKHRQCLTQYPVHGRELTISQFFRNILISFHCPSFLLFLLFTQIYRHFASLHLCNHVSWVFQTGMLRLREKSGFPKVAQWSVEELGPGPSVGREERDSPVHCTLTWCLRLIYWRATLTDTPGGGWGALQIPVLQDIASRPWRDLSIVDISLLPALSSWKAW